MLNLSWVTYKVVMRSRRCNSRSSTRMRSRSLASRLLNGSSSKRTLGCALVPVPRRAAVAVRPKAG
jgi:hypothetical protein